jgi:hypothetical protein
MLEYSKLILEKVSFDTYLFHKELKKSLNFLSPDEINDLLMWVKLNFEGQYSDLIGNAVLAA